MEIGGLTNQDHEVLGVEFCSGYTDSFGKWNTGFYCPTLGSGERVYCCGTPTHKYCCTKRDEERSPTPIDQTVLLGVVVGALLVVLLLTFVSCLICRKYLLHRKRHHAATNGGPLYRMHCSSTASGVANMYSFSGQTSSAATTPVEGLHHQHHLVDLTGRAHPPSSALNGGRPSFMIQQNITDNGHLRGSVRFGSSEGHFQHNDPPPPYPTDGPGRPIHLTGNHLTSSPSTTSFTPTSRRERAADQMPTSVSSQSLRSSAAAGVTSVGQVGNRAVPAYWATKL